ncbi:hypothetical protein DPMN_064828 [Dreissena polymorpha]|uniref:Uncharacterized protein n=1 Tax=Dreissena polymorpha TaxID=45954 RepID=A0A9D4HLD9_DREPO|nr:hypothetical protein DPMN_064825 [Dreissena polymorpha]KAH3721879.1 hypothetical protein DPMN_064828 [Dreissena polymorpha]
MRHQYILLLGIVYSAFDNILLPGTVGLAFDRTLLPGLIQLGLSAVYFWARYSSTFASLQNTTSGLTSGSGN